MAEALKLRILAAAAKQLDGTTDGLFFLGAEMKSCKEEDDQHISATKPKLVHHANATCTSEGVRYWLVLVHLAVKRHVGRPWQDERTGFKRPTAI